MSIATKKVQKKSKSDHSVFRKQENNKSSLNKQNSSAQDILTLHQTIGNQAVQRLFESGFIQGKLTVGESNDKYEQEADRVADEVMRMPVPQVQRQSEEDEEEEMIQPKPIGEQITPLVQRQVEPEEEEEETIQAKSEGQTPQITPNLESKINAMQCGGHSLSKETRNFFEPRFGTDFSQVKIHTDSNANQLARSINARAFTKGNDIVFGGGEYSPASSSGKRLLGHELTHVVQQNRKKRNRSVVQKKENNTGVPDNLKSGIIPKHAHVIYEYPAKKIGNTGIKLSAKVTFNKRPSGASKKMKPVKVAIASTEYNPQKGTSKLKMGSVSIEIGSICGIKLSAGSDIFSVNSKGEFASTIKIVGSASYDINTFIELEECSLLNGLKFNEVQKKFIKNPNSEIKVEFKGEKKIDPVEWAKLKKMNKLEKNLEHLKDEAKQHTQKMKDRERAFNKKENRKLKRKNKKGKRYKRKKWNNSRSYKDLKRKSNELAKKITKNVDEIVDVAKTVKGKLARKIASKILAKITIIIEIIDTLILVAKIVKYWEDLKLQLPWKADGVSIDDMPLLGDIPKKGEKSSGKKDSKGTDTTSQVGTNNHQSTSTKGETPSTTKFPSDSSNLSSEMKEKIKKLSKPRRNLIEAMIQGKDGTKIQDKDVSEILNHIPKDLTAKESELIRSLVFSASGQTIKIIKQQLLKTLQKIRGKKGVTKNQSSLTNGTKVEKGAKTESIAPDIGKFYNIVFKSVFKKGENGLAIIVQEHVEEYLKNGLTNNKGLNFEVLKLSPLIEKLSSEDSKSGESKQKLILNLSVKVVSIPKSSTEKYKYKVGQILNKSSSFVWFAKESRLELLIMTNIIKNFIDETDNGFKLKKGVAGKVQDLGLFNGLIELQVKNKVYTIILVPKAPVNEGTQVLIKEKIIDVKENIPIIVDTINMNTLAKKRK